MKTYTKKMYFDKLFVLLLIFAFETCDAQMMQIGSCVEVTTKEYFNLDKFLGKWYEIERYPTWYEDLGNCAYKNIQACGRQIKIEHGFVKDGIEYVLHVNSTYAPGDEAVFVINATNIDPIGIPLKVMETDYNNYATLYGCKDNPELNRRYVSAWILSRERTLASEYQQQAHAKLNSIRYASTVYLETVEQTEEKCFYYWSAHVQSEDQSKEDEL